MKAAGRSKYGRSEVLSLIEMDKPEPGKNDLLVRVHATTVNRTDGGILMGKPFPLRFFTGLIRPKSPIPGTDFAGVIEAVGSGVTAYAPGDRVWGFDDIGLASQAEYLIVNHKKAVSKIPRSTSFEEAAASAEGAHYALNFINKVTLKAGDKILVNGATGAIGSASLQLLKYHECYVTAVGNAKNLDLLHSLGADRVIDYLQTDFTRDGERYQCVFDTVGKRTFHECKKLLLPDGAYISSELGPGSQNLYLPLLTKIKGGRRVIFPMPVHPKTSITLLSELLEKGMFKPVIDRHYPLEKIKDAYEYVLSGQKTGNVIITYH